MCFGTATLQPGLQEPAWPTAEAAADDLLHDLGGAAETLQNS